MKGTRLTGWRKIANALWGAPSDPQIYGALELDATAALEFIEQARARGAHVTVTHLVGRAIARALLAVPDLNVRLVGDRAIPRGSVDVFFISEKPVAISGRVEVRSVLPITASIDHRYVDGAQLGEALRAFREYIADPASFERAAGGENVVPLPPAWPPVASITNGRPHDRPS